MEEALWKGYRGVVRLEGLADECVIDRCAASTGDLTFRVGSGGTRVYGKRPLTPAKSTVESQWGFFSELALSLQREGQKVPILIWGINHKLYVRYGASRVWAARRIGWDSLHAVLCSFDKTSNYQAFDLETLLDNPADILRRGFGDPSLVGSFECSHERLDAHRMEP